MKSQLILKTVLLLATCYTMPQRVQAHCGNRVSHTAGTEIVKGISINVTGTTYSDTITTYCESTIQPYLVGYSYKNGEGTGSYTFKFSPSIDSLSLSFAGLNRSATYEEVVKLKVNGLHYAIPTVGTLNKCETLAELTTDGNIRGPISGDIAGWINTTIKGPISELTVTDSLVLGRAGGAIFSLNICSAFANSIKETSAPKLVVYPNPSQGRITIESTPKGRIEIVNLQGQLLLQQTLLASKTDIDISQFAKGLYILKLMTKVETSFIKVIKE